jgi:hypothetical protein
MCILKIFSSTNIFIYSQQISPFTDNQIFMKTLSFAIEMILLVFLPSYFGTQLFAASEKLSASLFYSDWMNQSKKYRSSVRIFMENLKKPMKVAMLYGLVTIDFAMFMAIGNFAYTLFAVFKKADQ